MREQVPEGVGGRIRRVHVHDGGARRREGAGDAGAGTAGRQPPGRRRCPEGVGRERKAEEGGRVGEGISGGFCFFVSERFGGVLWEAAAFLGFCRQQL